MWVQLDVDPVESLEVCNVCLGVLRDGRWVDAEEVIREIRSFDLPILPTFVSTLCPDCGIAQSAEAA